MAFRAGNIVASKGYTRAKELGNHLKQYVQRRMTAVQNGANADILLSIYFDVYRVKEELEQIRVIPGIADYAKAQEDDPTYDVATEFNALIDRIDSVLSYVSSAMPADANGYIKERKISGGTYEYNSFTAAQLSTLVTLLQNIDNAIE